jgi:hypothetical protein
LKHLVNDIDSIEFDCLQKGYDGIEFDLNFFPQLLVFYDEYDTAQPFKLFADVINKEPHLLFGIDLTHNVPLISDKDINQVFDTLLNMLPFPPPENLFFETSNAMVAEYLLNRKYQVIYCIQPFCH